MKLRFFVFFLLALNFSCSDSFRKNKPGPEKIEIHRLPQNKPATNFHDTLRVESIAAVFYSPDSLQLQKIKSLTDTGVFEGVMHEYDYLSRTAHSIIKKDFRQIHIIEAKNVRYLLFITADKKQSCIDLDRNYDPYGLYVFNRQKAPQLVDMANTETELGFYFSK
jgi:hypothetical protein